MIFNFNRLIKKYSVHCELITFSSGRYEGGDYIPGEEIRKPIEGALIPVSEGKAYQSGGAVTVSDTQFVTHEAVDLSSSSWIEFDGKNSNELFSELAIRFRRRHE
ncbi:MAG: hypothetical protein ACI4CT_07340, partial [Lachnospiraceae bacterium]